MLCFLAGNLGFHCSCRQFVALDCSSCYCLCHVRAWAGGVCQWGSDWYGWIETFHTSPGPLVWNMG